ncbi:MAG: DNA mismatch repair protein MutL [Geobacteraceae bacterium GWC2_58_44]|nr:MAG: DNA mismatch repair protein MutL [Geobacteraceae bacterium GWC2_58_44]HBG06264.1 DNA mismatch repair endonuclease MutL [Geobacter sp.]
MATSIKILPENLTNKIAAGEVVERPASVAKELVENALDAGSKEVVVEIESGGRRLIKVSDTGSGMSREDALLALERHATSKIACDEDLFSLSTLGFRGEALPSIASVSRLSISTRTSDTVEGTEIYAEGGRIKEVKGCGMAAGTVIAVRNLFFNTPARLKFMKSPETEGGHVGELLTRLAISRPDVRFSYLNDGKLVFRALDADLKERVANMLGRPIAASLYPVSYQHPDGLKVTGLVAAPECSRSAASHLYTYINGRFIKDKVVQHAILQAYRNFLERGRYPIVAVFIEIQPGEVDVNVHPTKHEVRFREQGRVHDAIQSAIESVLKETPWLKRGELNRQMSGQLGKAISGQLVGAITVPETAADPKGAARFDVNETVKPLHQPATSAVLPITSLSISSARVAEVRELLADYQARPQPPLHARSSSPFQKVATPAPSPLNGDATLSPSPFKGEDRRGMGSHGAADLQGKPHPHPGPPLEGEGVLGACEFAGSTGGYFSSLSVIGQFNASYILCQHGTDLVLIDQHAAHERVAFEKLKGEFAGKEVDSQGLLFPETIELSFRESAVVLEHLDELGRLGFELEEFGGNTWLMKGVPQLLASTDYLRTIRDILEELGSLSRSRTFSDIQEDILARIACHSVVRGRRTLTHREIAALFSQMDATDFSSNCPHGRPVMQSISLAEVEKMFKRG